jgi:hypothetical protein
MLVSLRSNRRFNYGNGNKKPKIPPQSKSSEWGFIILKQPYFFFNPTKYSTKFTASSLVIPSIKPVGIMQLGNFFMDFT